MKIFSWNIERGYYPDAVAEVVRKASPDVALLTELDQGNERTAMVDMFARLGEALGPEYQGRFAVEFQEKPSLWRRVIPTGGPASGLHGNAVFARGPIEDYQEIRLPTRAPLTWTGGTIIPELFEPRDGGRIAQRFRFHHRGRPVWMINVHLENWRSSWDHRREQLDAALAGTEGQPRVLAGDLNPMEGVLATWRRSRGGYREVRALREYFAERGLSDPFPDTAYTLFSYGLRAKFDWIAISEELSGEALANKRTPWSDHNCLTALARWRTED